MNKRIMVIWGMLVFIIIATLLIIGFNKKDKVLFKLERELKVAAKQYVKDNKIDIKFNKNYVVNISDLINDNYIKEDNIDKYCIKSVIVYKGLLLYEYKVNKECDKETTISSISCFFVV